MYTIPATAGISRLRMIRCSSSRESWVRQSCTEKPAAVRSSDTVSTVMAKKGSVSVGMTTATVRSARAF